MICDWEWFIGIISHPNAPDFLQCFVIVFVAFLGGQKIKEYHAEKVLDKKLLTASEIVSTYMELYYVMVSALRPTPLFDSYETYIDNNNGHLLADYFEHSKKKIEENEDVYDKARASFADALLFFNDGVSTYLKLFLDSRSQVISELEKVMYLLRAKHINPEAFDLVKAQKDKVNDILFVLYSVDVNSCRTKDQRVLYQINNAMLSLRNEMKKVVKNPY